MLTPEVETPASELPCAFGEQEPTAAEIEAALAEIDPAMETAVSAGVVDARRKSAGTRKWRTR